MTKRLISLVLCVLMIVALVGCNSNKRKIVEITLSTEDSEAILAAAGITLPDVEVAKGANSTIKWFSWFDGFHNYDEDEIVNTGYWTFKEKYGCEIEWVQTTFGTCHDDLANLMLGGTPPDFYSAFNDVFPVNTIKGMFQQVDEYIDYDDPLWSDMKDFVEKYFSFGDRHYIICCDTNFETVMPYNRRVVEEWGFDDPAELYYNDEWTWDKFYEMCVDFSDPDEDRFALDGWGYPNAIMDSCGITPVSLDVTTGLFKSNLDDPRLERAAELLYNLSKNECFYHKGGNYAPRGEEGTGMKDGLVLFWPRGTWAFTGPVDSISDVWGDIANEEIMFAPMPRDPDGDGNYYIQAQAQGYTIIKNAENPYGVALYAACERFKIVDPTVISIDERQKKEIYLWTDEMMDMYAECKRLSEKGDNTLIEYGSGVGDNISSVVERLKGIARSANATTWAQAKESNYDAIEYYLDELNALIEEHKESLE